MSVDALWQHGHCTGVITLECKLCHLCEFYSLGKCITREEGSLTTSYSSWQPLSAATAAKLYQLCPTLCDPIDSSPTGSSVPGILQARCSGPHKRMCDSLLDHLAPSYYGPPPPPRPVIPETSATKKTRPGQRGACRVLRPPLQLAP